MVGLQLILAINRAVFDLDTVDRPHESEFGELLNELDDLDGFVRIAGELVLDVTERAVLGKQADRRHAKLRQLHELAGGGPADDPVVSLGADHQLVQGDPRAEAQPQLLPHAGQSGQ